MNQEDYIALIVKQLSGAIEAREASVLHSWLQASEQNRRIADEMAMIWNKSGSWQKSFQPDLDSAFQDILKEIGETAPLKVVSLRTRIYQVAAAVAVLLLATFAFQQFNSAAASFDAFASANTGEHQLLALSDGTNVWLRKGSQLQYHATFDGQVTRQVRLIGEAYFEVAPDSAHPFIVETENNGKVEVLGTAFNIHQSVNEVSVLVRHGKVRFSPDGVTESPVLTANQKAVFDPEHRTLSINTVAGFNEIAWQTGGLSFVNTPLKDALRDIEAYYQVKINLQNKALENCAYSAPVVKAPVGQVLEALAVVFNLKVKNSGAGQYELVGGACPK